MEPAVAFFPAGLDACALYRMFVTHLHKRGSVFMFNVVGLNPKKFEHAQVAVVQRLCTQQNYNALLLFKQMGMKIVYDLDDDLWSVPAYNPAFKLLRDYLHGFSTCARMSDMITVSTVHLKLEVEKALGKQCPPVAVIENAMDFDWFHPVKPEHRCDRAGRVVLGWAGSNTHEGDVKKVFSLVPGLLREFPQLDIEIAGMKAPVEWLEFGARIRQRDFVPVAEYPSAWASWQWDVALAPLEENRFNKSKSSIKVMEAAAVKIPCVASDFGEYSKFCSTSKLLRRTILAESITQWRNKIADFIRDADLRSRIGEEMYRVAKERFDIVDRLGQWDDVFRRAVGGS